MGEANDKTAGDAATEMTTATPAKAKKVALANDDGREAPEPRRVVPLQVTRWQLGEFINARHSVSPAQGTAFEDLLRPEFWANIVALREGDIIEVRPEGQDYYAELFVLKRDRTSATVAVIRDPVKLVAAYKPAAGTKNFRVEFAGSHGKWRVIRISDLSVMREKFANEAEATRWLSEYEQMLAA
jgi:hypothetical protein